MVQIFLFSFLVIIGHIIVIRLYMKRIESGRSNDHNLALIFSLGLGITVLIAFFVPMLLFSYGDIRLSTILVGIISAIIWIIFGYPIAKILMKWTKHEE
jgi:ABC-type spermidine/putrescine transport system permease subunit I